MNLFDRLEALTQHLIEGTFSRLFQTQLPPAITDKSEGKARTKIEEMTAITPVQKANHWLLRLGERELRLGEPVVRIGRALDNDIVLTDPTVSQYHAQLRWREGCYHLCPPMPANGELASPHTDDNHNGNQPVPQITVNHQPVINHPLIFDDVITIGNIKLTVMVERGTA